VTWAIEHENVSGVIHAVSPYPVRNRDFMKALRKAYRMPFGLPNYAPFVKLGAWSIGTESELVLLGRRVVSKVLATQGFVFRHPEVGEALAHLLTKEKTSEPK